MPTTQLPSEPLSVHVSESELNSGRLDDQNLEIATRALHRDGLVVLENMVDHAKLDKLNEKMVKDAYELQSRGEDSPYNYNRGNIQQDPPLTASCWEPSIFVRMYPIILERGRPMRLSLLGQPDTKIRCHRPNCHAGNLYNSWTISQIEFRIRQHGAASNGVLTASRSAHAY